MKVLLSIFLLLLSLGPASGAIAHVQSKACWATAFPMTCAFAGDTTGGNLIIVAVRVVETGGVITGITDTGANPYVLAVSSGPGWGVSKVYIYYAVNIVGGANTVSVAITGTWGASMAIHEYSGLHLASPLDQVSAAQGVSGAGDSGAQTTTLADELVFGAEISNMTLAGLQGAGFTARVSENFGGGLLTEEKIVSSIASYSAAFQDNASVWIAAMATFKMAPAGGARRRVIE